MEKKEAEDRVRELFGNGQLAADGKYEFEVDGVRIRVPKGAAAVYLIGRQCKEKEVRRA